MGCFAKLGQLLRALASYSPLRLARWVFFGNDGGGKGRSKHAKLLQRAVAMASPFLLEEFEPRLLLSTVSLSENFDGSGYTTNSSRYNVAIVSKLSTDTHNTATTDGYLPQSDGSDIVVSLSCAAGDTGGSCGCGVASGDYNLQFDLYAMDNMNSDGSIGNGAYSVTAVNVDTGATIDTVSGNLSDLTPTAGNVNGTYTGDTSSYTAGTWPTYDTTGCGPGCCSATAPYVEDPDYDMTIPLHLENASQINIHINVTGMNGTYAAGQFGVDNIILSGDLTVTQASTRPTSSTGALVTWQSDPYATAYVVSASTDGTTFTPVGYANPGDTGMLLTSLTAGGSYTFEVDAFTPDGTDDAEATTGTITLSGGTPGVYTVSSSDGLTIHHDAGTAPGFSSSMDIANDTVAAGSAEEAVLMALDPNGSILSCGAGDTYAPLSGGFEYFSDYVTTAAGDLGAAGTDVGSAVGLAENWQPGDDFSSFGFQDDFMLVSATKVNDFNVSVQTDDPMGARDTGEAASFTLGRQGDVSGSGTINFHISGGADSYTVSGEDSGALSYNSTTGYGAYTMAAGEAAADISITPAGSGTNGSVVLTVDTGSYSLGAAWAALQNFTPSPSPTEAAAASAPAASQPTTATATVAATNPAPGLRDAYYGADRIGTPADGPLSYANGWKYYLDLHLLTSLGGAWDVQTVDWSINVTTPTGQTIMTVDNTITEWGEFDPTGGLQDIINEPVAAIVKADLINYDPAFNPADDYFVSATANFSMNIYTQDFPPAITFQIAGTDTFVTPAPGKSNFLDGQQMTDSTITPYNLATGLPGEPQDVPNYKWMVVDGAVEAYAGISQSPHGEPVFNISHTDTFTGGQIAGVFLAESGSIVFDDPLSYLDTSF